MQQPTQKAPDAVALGLLPDLGSLSIPELIQYRDDINSNIKKVMIGIQPLGDEAKRVQEHITERFRDQIKEAYDKAEKQHGKVKVELRDGINAEGDASKTVKWDSSALQQIAKGMSWEHIQYYFKIEFSVPEAIFKAIPPGPLRDAIENARTVKYGDPKITLISPDA